MTLSVGTKYHACAEGATAHNIEANRLCSLCRKSLDDLDCPPGEHEPVYSHNIEIVDGAIHRRWICRVCLMEGAEPMPDAQEFALLKGRLAEFKSRPPGGAIDDGPVPDLRREFPRSFVSDMA